jgi:integrase
MRSTSETLPVVVTWAPAAVRGLLQQAKPGTYKDPGKSGFGLRINADRSGTWVYRFRAGDSWPSGTLGAAALESGNGKVTFEDAKHAFEKLKGDAQKMRKAVENGMTLARAFELYVSGRMSNRTQLPLAPETLRGMRGHFHHDLAEAHAWHLETVSSLQWQQILLKVKARSPHGARRSYWLLHGIYSHLLAYKEIAGDNPLDVPNMRMMFSPKALKKPRSGHLAALDIRRFWCAITLCLKFKTAQEAIKLLLLLGWRRSAVLHMRWAQVDFEKGYYNVLPGDCGWKGYTGPIAMSDYALAVLVERKMRLADERLRTGKLLDAQLKRIEASKEWVFPAYRGSEGPMREVRGSFNTVSKGLPYHVQAHDLRRGFATLADIVLSGDRFMVGRLLSHQQLAMMDERAGSHQTTQYVQKHLPAERIAANRIGAAIEAIGTGTADNMLKAKLMDRGMDLDALVLAPLDDDDAEARADERS